MRFEQGRINLPAVGMATAIALAVTFGVPLAMQHGGNAEAWQDPLAARHGAPVATEVAIEPRSIEVIAVRERTAANRTLSLLTHKRAG
jgi:hypothetical protein